MNERLSMSADEVVLSPAARWRNSKNNEILLIVTFSGGGTRAAALSYGVLKGLRDTPIPATGGQTRPLLSEVDMISSVSGGSFTAAYYGLFGDRLFADYERQFLKHPVQSEMIQRWLLAPHNWGKLWGSRQFNRTDLAAEYYDKQLFEQRTFSQMRPDMPLVVINSTDLSTGLPFSFTPRHMAWICSALGNYPVSRAVAASAAVPGVFSAITLKNFSGCQLPALAHRTDALMPLKFRDKARYPYLHLVDGGVADNLGIRSVLRTVAMQGDSFPALLKNYHLEHINTVAIIVVNSAVELPTHIAQSPQDPSLEDTLSAVTTLQSTRYNTDTLDLLSRKVKRWEQQMRQQQCGHRPKKSCQSMPFYLLELNLKQLPAPLAEETTHYPTSLELTPEQVDTLIAAGQYLLQQSPTYQRLLKSLRN